MLFEGSEILRWPVEVGSLSQDLQVFLHPRWWLAGFLNHQQYSCFFRNLRVFNRVSIECHSIEVLGPPIFFFDICIWFHTWQLRFSRSNMRLQQKPSAGDSIQYLHEWGVGFPNNYSSIHHILTWSYFSVVGCQKKPTTFWQTNIAT